MLVLLNGELHFAQDFLKLSRLGKFFFWLDYYPAELLITISFSGFAKQQCSDHSFQALTFFYLITPSQVSEYFSFCSHTAMLQKVSNGQVLSKLYQMSEGSLQERCPRLNWRSPQPTAPPPPPPPFTAAASAAKVVMCFVFVKLCNL